MTTIASRQAAILRRRAILALLLITPGWTRTARSLRDDLERIHGQTATIARIRSDLIWLCDVDLVSQAGSVVMLTDRGHDVVVDRIQMPEDE